MLLASTYLGLMLTTKVSRVAAASRGAAATAQLPAVVDAACAIGAWREGAKGAGGTCVVGNLDSPMSWGPVTRWQH